MRRSRAMERAARLDRICLATAYAVTVAWFLVYDHFRPDYLVDEAGHLGNIYHFLEGKPGWPEQMTMLPGYHFVVAALWQLHPPLKLLTLARLVTTLFALGGLAAFAAAWRRLHDAPPGRATLLFAVLPILQPFTGMAYTDAPALALILAGFAAQLAERRVTAALVLALALAVRQTNVIWVAFFVAWEWGRGAGFFARVRWLLALLGLALVAVLVAGRLTVGTQTGTEMRPNIATLHFAGLLALLLGLPAWLAHLAAAMRRLNAFHHSHPARTKLALVAAGGAIAALATTFANPHPWNRDLFWDGNTFTLLRNWPLVGSELLVLLRYVSAASVIGMVTALAVFTAGQPQRRALWLALAFGLVLPFGTSLVEPRYFIPVAAVALLFAELSAADVRRLTWWWALLCIVHAPFVARGLSLW